MEYIATMGLTNDSGLGILSIDYTDDTLDVEFVGGDKVSPFKVKIDHQDDVMGFYLFGSFYRLDEFIRAY